MFQTHASICSNAKHIILGVAIDDPNDEGIILIKKKGKVKMLQDEIESREKDLNFDKVNCNYTKMSYKCNFVSITYSFNTLPR